MLPKITDSRIMTMVLFILPKIADCCIMTMVLFMLPKITDSRIMTMGLFMLPSNGPQRGAGPGRRGVAKATDSYKIIMSMLLCLLPSNGPQRGAGPGRTGVVRGVDRSHGQHGGGGVGVERRFPLPLSPLVSRSVARDGDRVCRSFSGSCRCCR